MAVEVIYRPNRPVMPDGSPGGCEAPVGALVYYRVMQEDAIVAAYHLLYFPSINLVVSDLIGLIDAGLQGPHGEDYAVWFDGRMMAVIHQPMDARHQRIVLFNDPRNAPEGPGSLTRYPGWPSYEQWVAEGRGDLVYDLKKYPAPEEGFPPPEAGGPLPLSPLQDP